MFWTNNISLLFVPVLLPTDYMTIEEKLNTLTRLIIFVCLILALILRDVRIILLMIILVIIIVIIYTYQHNIIKDSNAFLNKNSLKVIDNEVCTKPSKHNPFMNPNMIYGDDIGIKACPISDNQIQENIEKYFDESMFRNVDDIYDRSTSKRQFYTVPVSSLPNDQSTYANWLYNRGDSCKEDTIFCYKNIYRDLRM
jgi:hypothetical protein